jgi:choline kinase
MRALMLAAGMGRRMGEGDDHPPKAMLRFGGRTLLERHMELLRCCGVDEVVIAVGYEAGQIRAELQRLGVADRVSTVINPAFEEGSVVTLWTLREHMIAGGDVLVMDADVLYGKPMLDRLVGSEHENCFLLDRDMEPGDEPVKLCVRDGRLVEFRKLLDANLSFDFQGESVGFFRFGEAAARRIADQAQDYLRRGLRDEPYEEVLRDVLLEDGDLRFGFEDVTGLPWLEIDFPQDVERARQEILPRIA